MIDIIIFDTGETYKQRKNYIDETKYYVVEYWVGPFSKDPEHADELVQPHADFEADYIVIFNEYLYDVLFRQLTEKLSISGDKIKGYWWFEQQLLEERYQDSDDSEIKGILEYIRDHRVEMFNYDWQDEYKSEDIEVYKDDENGLRYVMYSGKRMYMSKIFSKKRFVQDYVRSLLVEQDEKSPHFYWREFDWDGTVVIDLGTAEGNFSLSVIDRVDKVIMVETDQDWIEALKVTFKEYEDKVTIIDKFVSDRDDNDNITLKSILERIEDYKNKRIVIKMDIEGAEEQVIHDSIEALKEIEALYMLVCTYHHSDGYVDITKMLDEAGLSYETSPGYMYMPTWSDDARVQLEGKSNNTDLRKALLYVSN